ncbi:MAG: hypothetical protein M0006_15930 [Magnetospirillum sp.]|nr:hypothetical protein [Magnetospirillum sp.]
MPPRRHYIWGKRLKFLRESVCIHKIFTLTHLSMLQAAQHPRPTSTARANKTREKKRKANRVIITPDVPKEMVAEIDAAMHATGCKSRGALLEKLWRENRGVFASYANQPRPIQHDLLEEPNKKGALPRER